MGTTSAPLKFEPEHSTTVPVSLVAPSTASVQARPFIEMVTDELKGMLALMGRLPHATTRGAGLEKKPSRN